MALNQAVVTLEGFNATLRPGDHAGQRHNRQLQTAGGRAEFTNIVLGPGDVNFMPTVRASPSPTASTTPIAPRACSFPNCRRRRGRRDGRTDEALGHGVFAIGLASLGRASWACLDQDVMQAKSALCSPQRSVPCGATPDGGAPTAASSATPARARRGPTWTRTTTRAFRRAWSAVTWAPRRRTTRRTTVAARRRRRARTTRSRSARRTLQHAAVRRAGGPANDSPGTATVMVLVQRHHEQRIGERIVRASPPARRPRTFTAPRRSDRTATSS